MQEKKGKIQNFFRSDTGYYLIDISYLNLLLQRKGKDLTAISAKCIQVSATN
jgi:hypothetical protein